MTDEEILSTVFNDPNCGELAHELAIRLSRRLDEEESELKPDPAWAIALLHDGDDAGR